MGVKMDTTEIRQAKSREEWHAALSLWSDVFQKERAFFKDRIEWDPNTNWRHTWIAKVNGHLAAAVHLFPFFLNYDEAALKCGGIGNVAAQPEYRGRHLVRTLLNRQSKWMMEHDFDLSMLYTGIPAFYEKEDWHVLHVKEQVLEASRIPEESKGNRLYSIRSLKEHDRNEIALLYDRYNQSLVGPTIRSAAYWNGQFKWLNNRTGGGFAAFCNRRLVAYLRWEAFDHETLGLQECCYLPGHETALPALVQRLKEACPRGKFMSAQMPESHALRQWFERWGAHRQDNTRTMWKVIRLPKLCRKLEPIFSKHLTGGERLLVRVGSEAILFSREKGQVVTALPSDSIIFQPSIERDETDFIHDLLLGMDGEKQPYTSLFQKNAFVCWKTDRF